MQNLVLNSCKNHHWQHEDRSTEFPFQNGQLTQITVASLELGFEIFGRTSEQKFGYLYPFREGLKEVICVECDGMGIDIEATTGQVS